jgi:hypothetical protein
MPCGYSEYRPTQAAAWPGSIPSHAAAASTRSRNSTFHHQAAERAGPTSHAASPLAEQSCFFACTLPAVHSRCNVAPCLWNQCTANQQSASSCMWCTARHCCHSCCNFTPISTSCKHHYSSTIMIATAAARHSSCYTHTHYRAAATGAAPSTVNTCRSSPRLWPNTPHATTAHATHRLLLHYSA